MGKKNHVWLSYSVASLLGFTVTSLAASFLIPTPEAEGISYIKSILAFCGPFFPAFAVTALLLFAISEQGITKQQAFAFCLLKCWLLAGLISAFTPFLTMMVPAAIDGKLDGGTVKMASALGMLGFFFGLPSTFFLGSVLALLLHNCQSAKRCTQ